MQIRCSVEIDFKSGTVPGQLSAVVRFVTPAGYLIAEEDAAAVAVGKTLSVGPVVIDVELVPGVHDTPTPTPGRPAAGQQPTTVQLRR